MEKSRTCSSVMPCSVGSAPSPRATSPRHPGGVAAGADRSANWACVEPTDSATAYGSVTTTVRVRPSVDDQPVTSKR
jgi:hypothetical protein